MRKRNLPAFALMLFLVASPVFAREATDVASSAFRSVVMLVVSDAGGNPMAFGTGFFVKADVMATSYHVVDGASSAYIKALGQEKTYPIAGILAKDEENDVVLLQADTSGALPSLVLRTTAGVRVGDKVYTVGNPMGLEGTFAEGIVSALRKENAMQLIQITAPLSQGSSGGPILDAEGKVIGVAAGLVKNGQNLNFAIPADCVMKMLSSPHHLTALNARLQTDSKGKRIQMWHGLQAGATYEAVKVHVIRESYPILNFDDQTITAAVEKDPKKIITFRFSKGKFYQYDMAIDGQSAIRILQDIRDHTAEFGKPQTASAVESGNPREGLHSDLVMTWQNEAEHVIYVVSSLLPPGWIFEDPSVNYWGRVREVRTALKFGPPPIPTKELPIKAPEAMR